MKTCLAVVALLALAASFTPMEDTEAIFKDAAKLMNEMTHVMKPVKDKASAESAVPKLKLLNERLAALKEKELNAQKLPPEENRQLFAKHKTPIDAAIKAYGSEAARIAKPEEANAVMTPELSRFEETIQTMLVLKEARVSAARVQLKRIDKALQAYKLKTGEFPQALQFLTDGKDAPLNEKDLHDPWGQPYQYDASGTRSNGKMPDVWTRTPEKENIGNWEKEP